MLAADLDGESASGLHQLHNRSDTVILQRIDGDIIAIGIMQYFRTVGIRVPEDISIVGMDNISMSEIVKPALTTVVNDSAEFAEKAAQLLFDRLLRGYKGGPRELFCGRTLIVRDSVKKI